MSCKSSYCIDNNQINLDVCFKTKTLTIYIKSDYVRWKSSKDFKDVISFAKGKLSGFPASKIEPIIKDIDLYLNTSETFL